MKTLVCAWWTDDTGLPAYSSAQYSSVYVERLAAGFYRHTTGERRVVCLSVDDPKADGVLWKPLEGGHGWSRLMQAYAHPPEGDERNLFVGLDTVFMGPVDWLFEWDKAPLGVVRDPGIPAMVTDAVVSFNAEGARLMQRGAVDAEACGYAGMTIAGVPSSMHVVDKVWQGRGWPLLEDSPCRVMSYKAHWPKREGKSPSVVYFHGRPKPHDVGIDAAIRSAWHGA